MDSDGQLTGGSYRLVDQHQDISSEVDRLRAQALLSWDKELVALRRLGLRDGLRVVDLGCGPGFVARRLLDDLPDCVITGVEQDAHACQLARAELANWPVSRWRVRQASVTDTGLADASVDFAIARLVFQHLPQPAAAVREALRILRPGGRLVVIDIDDALWGIADPPSPIEAPILAKVARAQADAGGNRSIGRHLWRLLRDAGFEQVALEAIVIHSDEVGLEPFLPQLDPNRLQPRVAAGVISEPELDIVRRSRAAFLGAPAPFLLNLLFVASGQRPGAT